MKAIKNESINVLLTDGYSRQVLPMIQAFKNLGCSVTAICFSRLDVGYSSRLTNARILSRVQREDESGRLREIMELLKTQLYDIVVPTTDFSAILLSKNKGCLSSYAYIAVNDWDVLTLASDKYETMKICMQNKIPCTRTMLDIHSFEDVSTSGFTYPLVIKPKTSYGAIGFHIVHNEDELHALFNRDSFDIEQMVAQEYIPQTDIQYEAAMYIDIDNTVKTALVFSKNRWFPIAGGASTLNISVEEPSIVESCSNLLQLINWRGYADIDLIRDPRDGVAKIMEINPRVSGSVKICFLAGVNMAQQILENAMGKIATPFLSYKTGIRLRSMHTDLLWFIRSKERFRANPSWFIIKNTSEQIFCWRDPLPWFTYSIQCLIKYKTEMKKRTDN